MLDVGAGDVVALHLEGKVDRIVTMLPPGAATRPPDGMFPNATLLAATGSSIVVELNGPPDMTHFVVTTPTGTIGVVPIEGQALLHLDGASPGDTTVAAWRGEELLEEEPAVFC